METTITVSKQTRDKLMRRKYTLGKSTVDEVIISLIKIVEQINKPLKAVGWKEETQ